MQKKLVYVSTDIETDGPHIGRNSMLSLASAAFLENKDLIDTFTVNLHTLPEGESNPETMLWWKKFPKAYEAARSNCTTPEIAMSNYVNWVKNLPGHPVFVAYPLAFDFSYVVYYLERFAKENPFRFTGIDLRSLFMGLKKKTFRDAGKPNWPENWFENKPHTHIALDDALEQGIAFCNMLDEMFSKSIEPDHDHNENLRKS